MSQTSEPVKYEVCATCGALVGERALHEKWHRDLPGIIGKAMVSREV